VDYQILPENFQPAFTFPFQQIAMSSMEVPSPRRVTSDASLAILRSRGDPAPLSNGMRFIFNTSYMISVSLNSQAIVEIPDKVESVATLRFLEFDTPTAELIFKKILGGAAAAGNRCGAC
jgi:hypothetical protein